MLMSILKTAKNFVQKKFVQKKFVL